MASISIILMVTLVDVNPLLMQQPEVHALTEITLIQPNQLLAPQQNFNSLPEVLLALEASLKVIHR